MNLGVDASRPPCLIPLAGFGGTDRDRHLQEFTGNFQVTDSYLGGGDDTSQAL